MKYRKQKNSKWLFYIAIGIFVLFGLFLVEWRIHFLRINKLSKTEQVKAVETSSNSNTNQDRGDEIAQKALSEKISGLKIPIFMYHYIRDNVDPSDKIGAGLSVSTTNFARHLDTIKKNGYTPITFSDLASDSIPEKPIILTFDDGYSDFYQNAWPIMKKYEMPGVVFVIANYHSNDYLTDNQIIELSNSGIEIGSHTLTHPDLSLADNGKIFTEVTQSKIEIEKLIGHKVISFCYPAGKYNDGVVAKVLESDYQFAVTTKSGVANFNSRLNLSRFRITNETNISYYLK